MRGRLAASCCALLLPGLAACSTSSGPVEHLQVPPGYWNHPLGDAGRSVAFHEAVAAGRLPFTPVKPQLGVSPSRVEVLRSPAKSGPRASANRIDLIYRLPRSWGFPTADTRVVVGEYGLSLTPDEVVQFAHDNGELVDLGDGRRGALIAGLQHGVTVGRVIWPDDEFQGDVTGPASPPQVVLRVARAVVSARSRGTD